MAAFSNAQGVQLWLQQLPVGLALDQAKIRLSFPVIENQMLVRFTALVERTFIFIFGTPCAQGVPTFAAADAGRSGFSCPSFRKPSLVP